MKHNIISRNIAITIAAVLSIAQGTEANAKRYLVEVLQPDGTFIAMSISNHAADKITSKSRGRRTTMLMRFWREKTDKTLVLKAKFPLHEAPKNAPHLTRSNRDSYSLTREQLASHMASRSNKTEKEVRI